MRNLPAHGFWFVALLCIGCGGPSVDEIIPPFRAELRQLSDEADQEARIGVAGVDGWVFYGPELRHLSAGPFREADASPVPGAARGDGANPRAAILDFERQLDTLGVELLLVPVPPKAAIFPEKVSAAVSIPIPVPRLDPDHQAFYDQLRSDGVEVLDLTDLFIRERFHPEGPLYCRTDTHWSGTGCIIAATAIANDVRNRPWFQDLDTRRFGAAWYSTAITGDLTGTGGVPAGREEVRLRGVISGSRRQRSQVDPDPHSPVVLLGDSHIQVFHAGDGWHAAGAGLPDQLAFELGLALDVVAASGSGAAQARMDLHLRARADPDYWNRKRLVIWCFAARELTVTDGWPVLSVMP